MQKALNQMAKAKGQPTPRVLTPDQFLSEMNRKAPSSTQNRANVKRKKRIAYFDVDHNQLADTSMSFNRDDQISRPG